MDEYLDNYLAHHGIKGQRWGVRRYQNPDGTLTEEGKARNRSGEGSRKIVNIDSEKAKKIAKYVAIGAGAVTLAAASVYVAKNTDAGRIVKDVVSSVKDTKVKELPEIKNIKRQRADDVLNRMALSDKELREKINRLKTEKELKTLTDETLHPGRVYFTNLAKQVGNKSLSAVGAGAALYGVKALVGGKFNREELAKALFEGGPKKK